MNIENEGELSLADGPMVPFNQTDVDGVDTAKDTAKDHFYKIKN